MKNATFSLRNRSSLPLFFNNLSGYDSHLFIKNLGRRSGQIKAIPNNKKYISFSKDIGLGSYRDKKGKEKLIKHEIRFIDSLKFMEFPLADLMKNLSQEHFVFMKKAFGEKHEMLRRKGVYPYDYMNYFDKFDEKELPQSKEFYLRLNDSEISEGDYEIGKKSLEKNFSN